MFDILEAVKKNASYEAETSEMMHLVLNTKKEGLVVASSQLWENIYKDAEILFVFGPDGKEIVPPNFGNHKYKKIFKMVDENFEDIQYALGHVIAKEDFCFRRESSETYMPDITDILKTIKEACLKEYAKMEEKFIDDLEGK